MKSVDCLDNGYVMLVDHMGSDEDIAAAARTSYKKGTKQISNDRNLIRYLVRNWHTSPLEMCEVKFQIKLPIFVARQMVRHRTANINEVSARYSIMEDEYYIPEKNKVEYQSVDNKQGRDGVVSSEIYQMFSEEIIKSCDNALQTYHNALENNVARELSRIVLPMNLYTEWVWKIDLHNLFHFLKLRLDRHAQYEIRVYAQAMYDLVKDIFPVACEAFEDYRRNACHMSRMEMDILKEIIKASNINIEEIVENNKEMNKREKREFLIKMTSED